jgi:hypothetical protein
VHEELPLLLEYVPAEQDIQLEEPETLEYVDGEHG